MTRYRHEWKHEIGLSDRLVLHQRLRTVAAPDGHARDGRYFIRSLYFDNPADKALREKLDGVDRREKFRIRCYNGDTSLIRLEKRASEAAWGARSRRSSRRRRPGPPPRATGRGCPTAAGI